MAKEFSVEEIEVEDDEQEQISEYDIVSSPNDFNTLTINVPVDSGTQTTPLM
jgi:hypothetical protein